MRTKILTYTIWIFILILVQTSVLDYITVYSVKPNLLITFVVIAAFLKGGYEGAIVGFAAGMVQDMVSGRVLGLYSLLGIYLGFAVGSLNKRLYRENIFLIVFFTFIFTFLYESVFFLIYKWVPYLFGGVIPYADPIYAVSKVIFPEAVYNSVASIVLFIIFYLSNRRLEAVENSTRKY